MNISYKDYKKSSDIHGTVLYPAPMIAPMQFDILNKYIDKLNRSAIYDPFHGSSVSLYEATKINSEIEIFGSDINPFANLISRAKLTTLDDSIDDDIQLVIRQLDDDFEYEQHSFPNIEKWFRDDIINSLSKIRHVVSTVANNSNRTFLWVMLLDIIRKYSNTRSSTYKLHVKESDKIERMKNLVIEDYIKKIQKDSYHYKTIIKNKVHLYKTDSLKLMNEFDDSTFDMIISSPPYGDNKTTVPYGQFSTLALMWIPSHDLVLEGDELKNYSSIDSLSMGGLLVDKVLSSEKLSLLDPYLTKISDKKRKKVISFMADYFDFLSQIARLSKRYIALTLGNRTVDNVKIDLTQITLKFLEMNGFKLLEHENREIPNKRIPSLTSKVGDNAVSSMTKEYLIIMEKIFS